MHVFVRGKNISAPHRLLYSLSGLVPVALGIVSDMPTRWLLGTVCVGVKWAVFHVR